MCPPSAILKNCPFRKMDMFPYAGQGWEIPVLLGRIEKSVIYPVPGVTSFNGIQHIRCLAGLKLAFHLGSNSVDVSSDTC
jgi:hypothetical protein